MSFIDNIKDFAIKDYSTSNVLPSITIAQAILESGWGKSGLAIKGNNLFGIKKGYWQGKVITMPTQEYINGQWITVNADFRAYNSYGESISDHSALLQLNRYKSVLATKDYREQAKQLQLSGYATDPNYANLLIQIIEENELYKYDNVALFNTEDVSKTIHSYKESGKATVIVDKLSVRNSPTTKGNNPVDYYYKDEYFYYDSVYINNGYYWTSYISKTGVRRYVASCKINGTERYLYCI